MQSLTLTLSDCAVELSVWKRSSYVTSADVQCVMAALVFCACLCCMVSANAAAVKALCVRVCVCVLNMCVSGWVATNTHAAGDSKQQV